MLDIQFIRDNPNLVQEKTKQKGYEVNINQLLEYDKTRRQLQTNIEELRRQKNENSKKIIFSPDDPEKREAHRLENQKAKDLKLIIKEKEAELKEVDREFILLLKQVPNMPLEEVPVGTSEDENVVIRTVGDKPSFEFAPKNHWEIAQAKGWIDKERAAKVSGARFAYLKGDLVLLWQGLIAFAMSKLTDEAFLRQLIDMHSLQLSSKPFVPVLPPLMIKTEPYDAMDRLEPRDDRYKIEGEELWLQGSAEHVLGSMHANEVIAAADLPLRYVGFATSFRREAGTYGKDMEGIMRMHQFDKLEMESITDGATSYDEHRLMIAIQEALMQALNLPYQVLEKCTADIGKPNAKGVDINVWLPGQDKYRETHTADYMTDYQARRLQTKTRAADGSLALVHTNDATAFAQRPLIGIIENFQTADGDVRVPDILQPYLGGRDTI